jgi:hypothetical protein
LMNKARCQFLLTTDNYHWDRPRLYANCEKTVVA